MGGERETMKIEVNPTNRAEEEKEETEGEKIDNRRPTGSEACGSGIHRSPRHWVVLRPLSDQPRAPRYRHHVFRASHSGPDLNLSLSDSCEQSWPVGTLGLGLRCGRLDGALLRRPRKTKKSRQTVSWTPPPARQ